MKLLIGILLTSFLFSSCEFEEEIPLVPQEEEKVTETSNPASGAENVFRWPASSLPIKVKISKDLDDVNSEIERMMDVWESASGVDLFHRNGSVVHYDFTSVKEYYLTDQNIGIHNAYNKLSEIDENTLAVTQIHANFRSLFDGKNFYEIIHADIILNEYSFDFSTDFTAGTFDQQSVILHELGHLIGLIEHSSERDSIMYPYINPQESIQQLSNTDISNIHDLYSNPRNALSTRDLDVNKSNSDITIIIQYKVDGSHIRKIRYN